MKKRNTKILITEIAFKQFAENGFDSASIRTIAKEVGIRESAIYNHFNSKAAILDEILDTKVNHNLGAELLTDDILNKIANPKKFLQIFVEKLFKVWETTDERLLFSLLIKEATSLRENRYSLLKSIEEMTKIWEFIFEQMINFGTIENQNPSLLANEFISPIFFFRVKYFLAENSSEKKKIKKEISAHTDFFSNIILK